MEWDGVVGEDQWMALAERASEVRMLHRANDFFI